MSNIIINKENDFKNETISSLPIQSGNIIIDNNNNFDLRKEQINNIRPMLSNNSNTMNIPDGKKVKIRPVLNKKSLADSFSMMANPKKNMVNANSDDENNSINSSSGSSNEILSNNSSSNRYNQNNVTNEQYEEDYQDDNNDNEESEYSSYASEINTKKKHSNNYREEDDEDDEEEEDDEDEEDEDQSLKEVKPKKKTYEEIQQEKQKLLFNLERLQKQGYPPSKRYSMASSFEDIQYEHDRLKKQRDVEKSIKFSRKILMALVSGVEFVNGKFDPLDIKLEGWSENVMENIADYDEVFEELGDKYGESVKMAPELKLIALVGSSAFMFHLTNSLFKTASPKLSDILKQNPDIMRNISEAAAKNMEGTINKEYGVNDPIGNIMKNGLNMKFGPQSQPSANPFTKANQPKMNGPTGIDDLLDELNGNTMNNTTSFTNDDESVSSRGSVNIKPIPRRAKTTKKGGIQLDLR
jgi:hypothetical protein